MRTLAKIFGLLALAATLVPPLLYFFQLLSEPAMKGILLAGTAAWFLAAPIWLKGAED